MLGFSHAGESRLVTKRAGSRVTGGTINYDGPLTVRATATGSQSTLAGQIQSQYAVLHKSLSVMQTQTITNIFQFSGWHCP